MAFYIAKAIAMNTREAISKEILEELAEQIMETMINDGSPLTEAGLAVFIQRLTLANALMQSE
jgi:hypothetical protein